MREQEQEEFPQQQDISLSGWKRIYSQPWLAMVLFMRFIQQSGGVKQKLQGIECLLLIVSN